jgi:hypothetical protein
MAAMDQTETSAIHTNGNSDVAVPMNGTDTVVNNTPPVKPAKNQRRKQNAQNKNMEKFGGQTVPSSRKRPNNDNHTTGERQ